VLDVGCGGGSLLRAERFGSRLAVNVDAHRYPEWIENESPVSHVVALVDALPFRTGSVDLMLALDVIEHLDDDDAALAELARIAAPNARLGISVPAFQALWSAHDEAVGHRRRYSRSAATAALRRAGFDIRRSTYFFAWLVPAAVVRRVAMRGGASSPHGGLTRPAGVLSRAERWLVSRGIGLPAGTSVWVEGTVSEPERDGQHTETKGR
jgi:SAM-dependent methyltransferase